MPEEAFRVHGLSAEFLTGKPKFAEIVEQFLSFVGDALLVAHNAEFDLRFVNAELATLGHPALAPERIVDTLALARRRHPGSPNSLDALCQRYGIDTSRRTKHGALLDAEILAEVYAELTGGRQASFRPAERGGQCAARGGPRRAAGATRAADRGGRMGGPCRLHRRAWREGDLAPLSAEIGRSVSRVRPAPRELAPPAPGADGKGWRNRLGRYRAAGNRRCAPHRR